jgi:molybdopterin converting factor subunit 1
MPVTVRFFAAARDLAECESAEVTLPAGSTVADLRRALAAKFPALADLLRHSLIAVDLQYVGDATVLRGPCEAALIPPVSGG